jgi:hypothetical protein
MADLMTILLILSIACAVVAIGILVGFVRDVIRGRS